ncbi:reprolysin-like metallopeptidase [Marilutibacter penaei]|uniref:reprolysin-like metallopeptidase n=1 Tax=Marilutibacter penaei TaxID=2759900 RepID=UPI0015FAADE7|nr:FG-GAP-like repeat-containing protein [Lysobacter penaei]
MKKISWLLMPAVLCACTQDATVEVGGKAAVEEVALLRSDASSARPLPARRDGLAFASAQDRGSLVAYPVGTAVRRAGAYTWHAADVSEEHAFRAIENGEMTFMSPEGVPIRLAYERHVEHDDGNWTWIGKGADGQSAVITFGDEAAFGVIPQGDGLPLRLATSGGKGWVVETDRALLAAVDNEATNPERPDYLVPPKLAAAGGKERSMAGAQVQAATNGRTVIDVLIGYTNGYRAAKGGKSATQTRLQNLVDITNDAYVTSGINAEVRLVHSMEVNFPDNTANEDALSKLTGFKAPSTQLTPDAAFTALRAAREEYGADLVSLVRRFQTPENEGCGIAWLLGGGLTQITSADEYFGYSVVSDGQDPGEDGKTYYCREETFAHELGHNLGSTHDADTADNEPGAFSYSFGYKITSASSNFYTIMAYGDDGQTPYRVFSSPSLTACGGKACGTATADNVRSHNQTVGIIAGFRQTQVEPEPQLAVPYDFNGDGVSDILWRNSANGSGTIWLAGNSAQRRAFSTIADKAWEVVAEGDFNGDGFADVAWRHRTDGRNTVWLSGQLSTQMAMTRIKDAGWKVVGAGDFDGDGKSDLFWRHATTGRNTIWLSASYSTQRSVNTISDTRWQVQGVADFDGDGIDDVLWRHAATGAGSIWRSGSYGSRMSITRVSNLNWQIVGVGDFDADGRSDILWRDMKSGANTLWKGGNYSNNQSLGRVSSMAWKVVAVADYDADGRSDILWRNSSDGRNTIWRAASISNQAPVARVSNQAWQIH